MKDKRKKLFLDFATAAAKNKEIEEFGKKYPNGYTDWEKANFKNDDTVKKLRTKAIGLGIFSPNVTESAFFAKFACDLLPNSTYCKKSAPQPENNLFACLLKDPTNKLDKDTVIWQGDTTKWTFFNNNRWYDSKTGNKGTWSCKGSDEYIIKDDNGEIYDSATDKWVEPNKKDDTTDSNNTADDSKTNISNLKSDDLYAGKKVTIGAKGQIVGDIQQLLIDKGFPDVSKNKTPDNSFGKMTYNMVKAFQKSKGLTDDGIVGKNTWAALNGQQLTATNATTINTPDSVPGSDAVVMQESRKKILRKYLLEYVK